MKSYPRDVEGQLKFLPSSRSGRTGAARSGYRAQIRYDDQDWFVLLSFPDVEMVYPGEGARAYLTFLSPEDQRGKLTVGKTFQIREGADNVADGVVT